MSSTDVKGKKNCWKCEGEVHVYAIQCPYCGVDLTTNKEEIYESPYQFVRPQQPEFIPGQTPPMSPFSHQEAVKEDNEAKLIKPSKDIVEENIESELTPLLNPQFKRTIKPLLLLLPGFIFLVFSFALIFFSDKKGEFVLRWSGSLWPFYLLVALPMLFYGWKSLRQLEDD